MDKLAALRAFVEVAETGGFSSASRRLDLAASSVVRSVDALEESLGTVLFNRTTRQVTLSDAGTTYYTRAKKLLDDLAEADASVYSHVRNIADRLMPKKGADEVRIAANL